MILYIYKSNEYGEKNVIFDIEFYLKNDDFISVLKITYPGFSKINIDLEKLSKENTLRGLFAKEILQEIKNQNYDEEIIDEKLVLIDITKEEKELLEMIMKDKLTEQQVADKLGITDTAELDRTEEKISKIPRKNITNIEETKKDETVKRIILNIITKIFFHFLTNFFIFLFCLQVEV